MENKEVTTEFETRRLGQRNTPAILLLAALILALVACGVLAYTWSQTKVEAAKLSSELEEKTANMDELDQEKKDLGSALDEQRNEIDRTKKEWAEQVATLKKDHQRHLERTYAKMNGIVHDTRKTMEYMGTLEDKLKAGQSLDEQEAKDLDAIVSGLVVLHKQYEKPIHEFRELETFLSDQLQLQGVVPPDRKGAFFKRIFKKDYRKAEESYFRDQGRREAFENARIKVVEAYSRAQAEMDKVSLDAGQYLDRLDKIVVSDKASAADLTDFFEKSKEILKIHDKIMSIEPEKGVKPVKP